MALEDSGQGIPPTQAAKEGDRGAGLAEWGGGMAKNAADTPKRGK